MYIRRPSSHIRLTSRLRVPVWPMHRPRQSTAITRPGRLPPKCEDDMDLDDDVRVDGVGDGDSAGGVGVGVRIIRLPPMPM